MRVPALLPVAKYAGGPLGERRLQRHVGVEGGTVLPSAMGHFPLLPDSNSCLRFRNRTLTYLPFRISGSASDSTFCIGERSGVRQVGAGAEGIPGGHSERPSGYMEGSLASGVVVADLLCRGRTREGRAGFGSPSGLFSTYGPGADAAARHRTASSLTSGPGPPPGCRLTSRLRS